MPRKRPLTIAQKAEDFILKAHSARPGSLTDKGWWYGNRDGSIDVFARRTQGGTTLVKLTRKQLESWLCVAAVLRGEAQ